MSHVTESRIRFLSFPIILVALVIVGRLYFVQVVSGSSYTERADRQYVRPYTNLFDRGSIFFQTRDGDLIAAAGLKTGYTVSINPTRVQYPEVAYKELSKFIEIDEKEFLEKANKKKDPYEEIERRIDKEIADKITEAKIPGVDLYKERWRYYPGDKTASHTIGFLSFKGDKLGAYYGLENKYDDVLSRDSHEMYANFFTEILHGINKTVLQKQSLEGDIVLTIEPTVEGYVEDQVREVRNKFSSDETGAVVIDPKTGEIVAMALAPDFDPNNTKDASSASVFANKLVENVYEMGSILKPITVASGIDAGVINKDTTYNDKGFAVYDKATIYNYDKKGRGVVNMQVALNNSLNTGMAFIVEKMGKDNFTEYFKKFGIGSKTNIDLPYESSPLANNLDSSRMIEHVTASFGQGIALTPVGIARSLSILANGGYMITPHVVKQIKYNIGTTKDIGTEKGEQVIKPETSEEITRMLVTVVDKALLEGKIKHDRYAIAAKTGTAQIASPNGGYYEDRYLHSFFGYFPAYNPRFLVFMYTVNPKGVEYASHSLTEPFAKITDFLISYYNIPPDR